MGNYAEIGRTYTTAYDVHLVFRVLTQDTILIKTSANTAITSGRISLVKLQAVKGDQGEVGPKGDDANRAYKALLDLLVRKVSKALMEMTDSLVRGVYEERLAKEE